MNKLAAAVDGNTQAVQQLVSLLGRKGNTMSTAYDQYTKTVDLFINQNERKG